MNTAAFDATKEYRARHRVLLAAPLLLFAMDAFPFYGRRHFLFLRQHFVTAEKGRLSRDHQTLQHIMRVSNPRLHLQYEREVHNFDLTVWECERENIAIVVSYTKFVRNPVMPSHLLDTGDRVLEASPSDLVWGIGCRADNVSARQPPLWRGLNLLGKDLQTVRRLFRNRAPPTTRHHPLSPQGGPTVETASSKLTLLRDSDCVQDTRQQLPLRWDTPTLYQTCHRTKAATSLL